MDAELLDTTYLVGDRFAAFATKDRVETVNRFIGNVRSGLCDGLAEPVRLVAGQGVDESDWDTVRAELSRRGLLDRFLLPTRLPAVVPAADVHKRRDENVLLADVERRGPTTLAARLRLSDRNELVTDHVTGQHLSGMVVIEAGRQSILAATKAFVFTASAESASAKSNLAEPAVAESDFAMVLGSLNVAFERYVFPIAAELVVELVKLATSKPARMEFTAEVVVTQCGEVAARLAAEFQIVRARGLARQEETLAGRAIEAHAAAERDHGPVSPPAATRVCASTAGLRSPARVGLSS
ncbi:AfsA-related hotdog domain-containing protein [Actinokineospora iranica]|uniref:A-factor biosynthesis hotdog domain-containing protein n=1 Tax=Actinokineospora iranica TaxID=1271860 RepID=A0A1G6SPZ6_9PSEU|nr:AfsA-related hotdog domain-containing protein [Actinokineospora iranica]SDD18691.1 A-factor biosynthesis hotdog domain-containing protein [Actinokineospora iranica]